MSDEQIDTAAVVGDDGVVSSPADSDADAAVAKETDADVADPGESEVGESKDMLDGASSDDAGVSAGMGADENNGVNAEPAANAQGEKKRYPLDIEFYAEGTDGDGLPNVNPHLFAGAMKAWARYLYWDKQRLQYGQDKNSPYLIKSVLLEMEEVRAFLLRAEAWSERGAVVDEPWRRASVLMGLVLTNVQISRMSQAATDGFVSLIKKLLGQVTDRRSLDIAVKFLSELNSYYKQQTFREERRNAQQQMPEKVLPPTGEHKKRRRKRSKGKAATQPVTQLTSQR